MFRTTSSQKFMSWIINFVLKLMKILLEMELSSPSLVSAPDGCSWDDNSGLEVFMRTIKNVEFLQDHPSLGFSMELTSETPSSSIRPMVKAFCAVKPNKHYYSKSIWLLFSRDKIPWKKSTQISVFQWLQKYCICQCTVLLFSVPYQALSYWGVSLLVLLISQFKDCLTHPVIKEITNLKEP